MAIDAVVDHKGPRPGLRQSQAEAGNPVGRVLGLYDVDGIYGRDR